MEKKGAVRNQLYRMKDHHCSVSSLANLNESFRCSKYVSAWRNADSTPKRRKCCRLHAMRVLESVIVAQGLCPTGLKSKYYTPLISNEIARQRSVDNYIFLFLETVLHYSFYSLIKIIISQIFLSF